MKRIYFVLVAIFCISVTVHGQNMQPSNLIKTPLANKPNEDVAILKNPVMYGESNSYNSGAQVQGAIQIVTPLSDYMFDMEGTIIRFSPGSQEKIRFNLNAYGWSSSTINYGANPIKAFWDCSSADLNSLPVTIGNVMVDGLPKTTITIGNGNTNWGSYMTISIDKVYLTNMAAKNYLYEDSKWAITKVATLNSTDNYNTSFVNHSASKLNQEVLVDANGNLGIGTTTPQEKLSVNGKIRAKEIKVEAANWPDYVFEPGYQTKTLLEIEQFIKQHKHLPGVPTAKQVEQEGVELGEMNKILLKKIEELTLHFIRLEKKQDKISRELLRYKTKK